MIVVNRAIDNAMIVMIIARIIVNSEIAISNYKRDQKW